MQCKPAILSFIIFSPRNLTLMASTSFSSPAAQQEGQQQQQITIGTAGNHVKSQSTASFGLSRLKINRKRQEGNPLLKYIRSVPYEWDSEIK
jgi:hypothetical protein